MNILDKMIESERIYGADEPWAEYREALTDFIIANCRERKVQENPENQKVGEKSLYKEKPKPITRTCQPSQYLVWERRGILISEGCPSTTG